MEIEAVYTFFQFEGGCHQQLTNTIVKAKFYTTHAGLAFLGPCINRFTSLPQKIAAAAPQEGGIPHIDIITPIETAAEPILPGIFDNTDSGTCNQRI